MNENDFYTAEQAAELLGCTKKVLEAKLRSGELVGSKRLNKWFVLRSDLLEYLEGGRVVPGAKKRRK